MNLFEKILVISIIDILELLKNGYIILTIMAILGVLLSDKKSSSMISWIFTIIIFPFLGPILYFSVGIDWRKRQRLNQMRENYRNIVLDIFENKLVKHDATNLFKETGKKKTEREIKHELNHLKLDERSQKVSRMLYKTDKSYISNNESCKFYFNGEETFEAIKKDLRKAKHNIEMEFYIWKSDKLGEEIKDILVEKSKEGVKVKLIFDGVGSIFKISRKYKKELRDNGIEYKYFLDLKFKVHRFNYRNHRKMIIIDHKILHTGGMNIGTEYIDGGPFKYWRDTNVRIVGELTYYYLAVFIADWLNSGGSYEINNVKIEQYNPDKLLQVAISGPDSAWATIKNAFNIMISEAKKEILIQSPYFIPDETLLESLQVAALSGLEVKLMMTGIPDKKVPFWVAQTYFESLLMAGVKIYQYKKGFMHNKNVMIDGKLSTMGTCNFDSRSFEVNYEINTVFYNKELTEQLRDQFFKDIKECEEVKLESILRKNLIKKLRNAIFKLFSPLL